VVYIQNAPQEVKNLIDATGYKEGINLTYLATGDSTEQIEADILAGDAELLVIFADQFMENADSYKNAEDTIPKLTLCYNTTGNYSSAAVDVFRVMVLDNLERSILAARFGNLNLLTAFETESKIIVDEDKANGEFIAMMLPYFITFMLFVGAMSLGVDAITGEKERGTMASMLLSPIKRRDIVVGKLVSLSILSAISAAIYAISMLLAMPMITKTFTGGESVEIGISFSVLQIAELFAIMLAMVYLYVALVAFVAVLAKTAKEAGAYVSPIYILVMVCGLLTMFTGGMEKSLGQYAIPIYGNALAIQNLMTNELTGTQFLLSFGGTILAGVLFTVLLTKAFNSERIMFNA
jgi:sodium transport system permease protein